MAAKRRVHLGVDYGTSASKIVFRDYGAPGGDKAIVVTRSASFRIPSRVCLSATDLFFGDETKSAEEFDVYESIKMWVAAEVSQHPSFFFGIAKPLPSGLSLVDLAILSVWYLVSEGHRAVESYLGTAASGVNLGMTMGVPMAFFRDQRLKNAFLSIARRAWSLYKSEGLLGPSLALDRAIRVLRSHDSILPELKEYEIRDWIRSEAEAAMWWAFQSPTIAPGPYGKVDIGAGTTHASLYRIYGAAQVAKTGIAFLGAASVPVGMDAIDTEIIRAKGIGGYGAQLRGLEEAILQSDPTARIAIQSVEENIREAYRKAWIETHRKIRNSPAEVERWRDHNLFFIGGGSLVSTLVESICVHPAGGGQKVLIAPLEQPPDLSLPDGSAVSRNDLRFLGVAYGLSNIGLSIPEALSPDEIPPMPEQDSTRDRLDRDDLYAK